MKARTDSIASAKATLAVTVAAAQGIVSEKEDLVVETASIAAGEVGVIGLEEVETDSVVGDSGEEDSVGGDES